MRIKSFNISFGAQLFKALSDESRLRVLHLLYKNEKMCISDLEAVLDFTQTKTSRHLSYLKNSNMVLVKRIDQFSFYSLSPQVKDFMDNMFKYLSGDSLLLKDYEVFKIMYSNRELRLAKLELKRKI